MSRIIDKFGESNIKGGNHRMIREKIWYEMADIKVGECYLASYLNQCKNRKKIFKGLTILFSTSGVFGWKFWEYYAAVACGAIALIQLLTTLSDQFVKSDDELREIANLRNFYTKYFNRLEELWVKLESDQLTSSEATQIFFDLKNSLGEEIQALDNSLHINGKGGKLHDEAESEAENYLTTRYVKTKINTATEALAS